MTDKLLLTLADMADISPKKVRLIINAYEKAKTGYKPVPEGYTAFKYKGKRYAYKSLGDGPWTPECASVKLMRILRNYFINSGMMKVGGIWPGSSYCYVWTSDVNSFSDHVGLNSYGYTYSYHDGNCIARFAVLPQDSERKIINTYKKATTGVKPVPEGYTAFEYEGKRYAYKSLGDGPWTPECASLELMKVLKNYFISSDKMEGGSYWPGSSLSSAWTSGVDSDDYHVVLYSDGYTGGCYDGHYYARFAVLPL